MEKLDKELLKKRENKKEKNNNKKIHPEYKLENPEKENKSFKFKLLLNELKIPILSLISFFFYYLSFKGCNGTQSFCLVTLSPGFFYSIGIYIIICSLITLYILYQVIRNKISKYHLLYYLPILIYLLYFVDNGSDLSHHGSYNKMGFYVMFIFFIIIFFIFILVYIIIQIKDKDKEIKIRL